MKCQCCKAKTAIIQVIDVDNWKVEAAASICDTCAGMVVPQFMDTTAPMPSAKAAIETAQTVLDPELLASAAEDDDSESEPSLSDMKTLQQLSEKLAQNVSCDTCGTTLAEFQKSGRLGCASCYEAFWQALEGSLERIHDIPNVANLARRPGESEPDQAVVLRQRLLELNDRLGHAVETENYERAAQLRDEIRELEEELGV